MSGLPYDAGRAVRELRRADPVLAAVIDRVGPCRLELETTHSLFSALLRAIVYQQLHARAASAIHARVLALLPSPPEPEALPSISDEALRAAGLSMGKLRSIRDLADKAIGGTLPSLEESASLTDEALAERLCQVRGIGPWTVHMLLLFRLGRPDIMPVGDFAIRLAFSRLYRRGRSASPASVLRHSRRWMPWRSVASWYLWRSLESAPVAQQVVEIE